MDPYADAFASFVAATDEKDLLATAITRIITTNKVRELCDIGAGAGDLAVRLASAVPRYLAIERHPEHLASLRALGIPSLETKWPTTLSEKFGAVLFSHVLDTAQDVERMLAGGLDALKPNGILIIVLHKIRNTAWAEVLNGLSIDDEQSMALETSVADYIANSTIRQEDFLVETHLETPDANEFTKALSFVVDPDAQGEARIRIEAYIRSRLLQRSDHATSVNHTFTFVHRIIVASSRPSA